MNKWDTVNNLIKNRDYKGLHDILHDEYLYLRETTLVSKDEMVAFIKKRFEEGLTLEQYVQIAGGTTSYALNKNAYLLKADGSVRFYRSSALKNLMRFDAGVMNGIEAGDAIVIPTDLDYDPPLIRVSAITNVVFQSLTSIAAFLSITAQ